MKHLKKYKALLVVIAIGLVSLPSIVKDLKVFAEKANNDIPQGVMCYRAQVVTPEQKKLRELQSELNKLEDLYAEGKINTETYTARKEKLMYQIDHKQGKN